MAFNFRCPPGNNHDEQAAGKILLIRLHWLSIYSLFQMFFQFISRLTQSRPHGRDVTQSIQQTVVMDEPVVTGNRHIDTGIVEFAAKRLTFIAQYIKFRRLD